MSAACTRVRGVAAFLGVAAIAFGSIEGDAHGANGGPAGLPPAAKARPSASVPADLPVDRLHDCRLLNGITVYRGVGRGTVVGVAPADVFSPLRPGCAGAEDAQAPDGTGGN
jgi:hypothetical protein